MAASVSLPTPRWFASFDAAVRDRVAGALWGAWLGDAAGAVLEFMSTTPTKADVARALRYPGGGVWRVAPGQVTDDGELTACLWLAVRDAPDDDVHGRTLADRASDLYRAWYRSGPFDVGNTTRNAVSAPGTGAAAMREQAARLNRTSQSNGALMRCIPLAIAAVRWDWDPSTVAAAVSADVSLTHPARLVAEAEIAYVLAAAALLRHGNAGRARAAAEAWIRDEALEAETLTAWLADADNERNMAARDVDSQMGWLRHAWVLAFHHLGRGTRGWEAAVAATLVLGGDTDTNACIVGALIGARVGHAGLPPAAVHAVAACHAARPPWMHPANWLTPVLASP
jgi:ADP-ribosyl-[dinitrogen reductase] hydrolase